MAHKSPKVGIAAVALVLCAVAILLVRQPQAKNPSADNSQPMPAAVADGGQTPNAPIMTTAPQKPVLPDSVHKRVEFFKNAETSLEIRQAELEKLEAAGDPASIEVLIAVASDAQYLNRYAVESLGRTAKGASNPGIDLFLKSCLLDADARIAAAASVAFAQRQGAASVPALADAMTKNSRREDGYSSMVCLSIVQALGQTGSRDATACLVAELSKPGTGQWTLDYGSEVLQALKTINDPAAKPGVDAYAVRLKRERPNDLMAGQYYEEKIAEAERVSLQWSQR